MTLSCSDLESSQGRWAEFLQSSNPKDATSKCFAGF